MCSYLSPDIGLLGLLADSTDGLVVGPAKVETHDSPECDRDDCGNLRDIIYHRIDAGSHCSPNYCNRDKRLRIFPDKVDPSLSCESNILLDSGSWGDRLLQIGFVHYRALLSGMKKISNSFSIHAIAVLEVAALHHTDDEPCLINQYTAALPANESITIPSAWSDILKGAEVH